MIGKAAGTLSFAENSIEKMYGDTAFSIELTNTGDGAVSYSSSDSSVATVSESGQVTIRGVGMTTIWKPFARQWPDGLIAPDHTIHHLSEIVNIVKEEIK